MPFRLPFAILLRTRGNVVPVPVAVTVSPSAPEADELEEEAKKEEPSSLLLLLLLPPVVSEVEVCDLP